MAVKRVTVQIQGFEDWKRRATDRGLTHLSSWAAKAIKGPEIYDQVPVDTGALRDNTATKVESGRALTIWFYWKMPYADLANRMPEFGKAPLVSGKRSPFAEVGVYEAAQTPSFKEAVRKFLEGD